MGTSTNGIICLGIPFEESTWFPWYKEDEEDDYCPEDRLTIWWRELGHKEEDLPVEMVNYSSSGCPMFILAVKGSVHECNRVYPTKFNIDALQTGFQRNASTERKHYVEFMEEHIFKLKDIEQHHDYDQKEDLHQPEWLIASYWSN